MAKAVCRNRYARNVHCAMRQRMMTNTCAVRQGNLYQTEQSRIGVRSGNCRRNQLIQSIVTMEGSMQGGTDA